MNWHLLVLNLRKYAAEQYKEAERKDLAINIRVGMVVVGNTLEQLANAINESIIDYKQ